MDRIGRIVAEQQPERRLLGGEGGEDGRGGLVGVALLIAVRAGDLTQLCQPVSGGPRQSPSRSIKTIYDRWMDLRQLTYLTVIAEEENRGRAAQRLYVSQPALSYALKSL